jgi:hypothetical protein
MPGDVGKGQRRDHGVGRVLGKPGQHLGGANFGIQRIAQLDRLLGSERRLIQPFTPPGIDAGVNRHGSYRLD